MNRQSDKDADNVYIAQCPGIEIRTTGILYAHEIDPDNKVIESIFNKTTLRVFDTNGEPCYLIDESLLTEEEKDFILNLRML